MDSYEVRQVNEPAELAELHIMARTTNDPAMQCTPGRPYPSAEQLQRAHRVYAAYLDGRPVACVLVSERGQGWWLNGDAEHLAPATVALMLACYADFGAAWGVVPNDTLRAAVAAASDGRVHDDGPLTCWIGIW